MKMSGDVKFMNVPHQWGEIGQWVGQLQKVGSFSSTSFVHMQGDCIIPEGKHVKLISKIALLTTVRLWETKHCIWNSAPTPTPIHTHSLI